MGTIKDLHDLIKGLAEERGTSPILRERLGLAKDLLNMVLKENEDLKKQVANLKDLTADLAGQLAAKARAAQQSEEFVEQTGVLFKRKTEGGYHEVPYCPKCRLALSSPMGELPFHCYCGFSETSAATISPRS